MEKAKGSPQHKFERRYLMAAPDVFRISDDEVMDEIKLSEYISKNDALVSTRYKKLQDAYE